MPGELQGGQEIKFGEAAYEMGAGAQGDFDSPVLRLRYSSLSTSSSTIDYNMQTGQRCLRSPCLYVGSNISLSFRPTHAFCASAWLVFTFFCAE